jgi:hypothetical protein
MGIEPKTVPSEAERGVRPPTYAGWTRSERLTLVSILIAATALVHTVHAYPILQLTEMSAIYLAFVALLVLAVYWKYSLDRDLASRDEQYRLLQQQLDDESSRFQAELQLVRKHAIEAETVLSQERAERSRIEGERANLALRLELNALTLEMTRQGAELRDQIDRRYAEFRDKLARDRSKLTERLPLDAAKFREELVRIHAPKVGRQEAMRPTKPINDNMVAHIDSSAVVNLVGQPYVLPQTAAWFSSATPVATKRHVSLREKTEAYWAEFRRVRGIK